ncbi:MAG: CHAT domain-containing protein [Candidatus Krumholzibacteria bacterium]|nr:CHAT domain-containing protein [Candidatus Krumholzibacteria bacterium]
MFAAGRIVATVAVFLSLLSYGAAAQTWEDLLKQADALSQAQKADSALILGKKALKLVEKAYGTEDTTTARALHHVGIFSTDAGNYDDAISCLKRALSIRERAFGSGAIAVGHTKYFLADAYFKSGENAQAEELLTAALAIYRSDSGEANEWVGKCVLELANVERALMKWPEAIAHFKEAQAIFEKLYGPENSLVARTLLGRANLYREKSEYRNAEAAYKGAISIWERTAGPLDHNLASAYDNLASSYRQEGRFAESEEYHKKALGIVQKILRPDHPDLASYLCNTATLYCDLGKFAEAESLYTRALTIEKKAYGVDNSKVAETLDLVAGFYFDTQQFEKAEEVSKQCLAIKRKELSPNHYLLATNLSNLAVINYALEDYAEVESLLKESIEIYEAASAEENHYAAAAILNLATYYMLRGNYPAADSLNNEALAIYEKIYGPDHLDVALTLEALATSQMVQEDPAKAIALGERAFKIRWQNFQNNGYILPEEDALIYSAQLRGAADLVLSFYFALPGDAQLERASFARGLADIALASKGNVSDIILGRQRSLAVESDSIARGLEDSYRATILRSSELFAEKPTAMPQRTYRRQLDSLQQVIDQMEAELNRHSESFREKRALENISCDRIRELLPQGATLVEYVKYDFIRLSPADTQSCYLAVTLDNTGPLAFVDLGGAAAIDSLVTAYLEHMGRMASRSHAPLKEDMPEYERIARKLYSAVIGPVENRITGKTLVLIAPDGALNSVSFAGLVDKRGRYLIEDVPIHYLSTGRDLIRLEHRNESGAGLFALGDPDFDATPAERLSRMASAAYAMAGEDASINRKARVNMGNMRSSKLARLPRSQAEVKEIVKEWRRLTKEPVAEFLGAEASEDNFVAQAPGKRIIHLATHGYFYEAMNEHLQGEDESSMQPGVAELNPLLLSGLFFAGANYDGAASAAQDVEDGLLTAYEVSAMNLAGTDMVVLSACESALGAIRSGEGVYGLRRAFEMAGVRTIVSALWPVPDAATARLMSQLYAHSEQPIPDRIRRVQMDQIKKLRAEGSADHPYSWAAFIAIGDWHSLWPEAVIH